MRQNLGIKGRIAGLSIGGLFVLGLFVFGFFGVLYHTQKNLTLKGFVSYAQALEFAVSAQFYERYGDVQAFALNPVLQSQNKNSIEEALNSYVRLYGIYDLILFVDLNGNFIASNNVGPNGSKLDTNKLSHVNFANETWFKAVVDNHMTVDENRGYQGTHFEGPLNDSSSDLVYGGKSWVTGFSAPVKGPGGKIIGVLSNRANMKWVEGEYVNSYLSMRSSGMVSPEMALVDEKGLFLVEHTPEKESDYKEVKRDWEVLAKKSLHEEHPDLWEMMQTQNSGYKLTFDQDLGYNQAAGYFRIDNNKFPSSIGWKVVVMQSESELFRDLNAMRTNFVIGFLLLFFVGIGVSYYFSQRISSTLILTADELQATAQDVIESSKEIRALSDSLKEDSSHQAAAVQETVATLDEVDAMAQRTNENAKVTEKEGLQTVAETEKGLGQVEKVIGAIREIELNNQRFAQEMHETNREVGAIVKLISEVNSKTKVINDIVFQTKLLSFNASVEAARAGESGKGFAVVAEEVGNLAQMSGRSANEIASLLESTSQQVQAIVTDNSNRLSSMLGQSTQKIEVASSFAGDCRVGFTEIAQKVERSKALASDIVVASSEQNVGVNEITQAMRLIDEMVQRNARGAAQCATTANQLDEGTEKMKRVLTSFNQFIRGAS
jgi:methyl-accepting chemotaxis protein